MNASPHDASRRSFLLASASSALALSLAARHAAAIVQPGGPALNEGDSHRGPCVISSTNGLRAVARAMDLLRDGFDPADAIVQGVKIIEDDPNDDSVGYGGLPNADGVVELDASVMHGPTHKSGAVAGIRDIKNPAHVALMVLRKTNHCLLVGEGAKRFAISMGFEEENLLTEAARQEWEKWKFNHSKHDDWLNDEDRDTPVGKTWDALPWQNPADAKAKTGGQNDGPKFLPVDASSTPPAPPTPPADTPKKHSRVPGQPFTTEVTGTVHCSALTKDSNIASCTSTSGLNWKIPGRVGDSPIIGAGNYCDNDIGAAGSTGRGENAIVNLAAFAIVEMMKKGMTPNEACMEMVKRVVAHNKEKRHKRPDGRPDFSIKFYALRKDGAYGGASLTPNATMAVHDGTGAKVVKIASLYETE